MAFCAGLLAGCASADAGANPRVPESSSSALLRPGDTLTISLQGIPDPSQHNAQIDDQGLINLPYIGNVTASGSDVGRALAAHPPDLHHPQLLYHDRCVGDRDRALHLRGRRSGAPGTHCLDSGSHPDQGVQSAGGFTLYAKETRVASYPGTRSLRDRCRTLRCTIPSKTPSRPGDSVQVPRSPF